MTSQRHVARCEPGACRTTGLSGRFARAFARDLHSPAAFVQALQPRDRAGQRHADFWICRPIAWQHSRHGWSGTLNPGTGKGENRR